MCTEDGKTREEDHRLRCASADQPTTQIEVMVSSGETGFRINKDACALQIYKSALERCKPFPVLECLCNSALTALHPARKPF